MKKAIAVFLSVIVLISALMLGCSKKEDTQDEGFEANADEYVLIEEEVTDENGEVVTDPDGNAVMQDAAYKIITDE